LNLSSKVVSAADVAGAHVTNETSSNPTDDLLGTHKDTATTSTSNSALQRHSTQDLKKVPHLILGETEEEKDKDQALLSGLSQLQREEELYHHEQQIKAQEEFLNVPLYLAEQKKRLDKLALERRKREEEEEKKLMKVMILLLLFLFITH
jgi:hypothetical protein